MAEVEIKIPDSFVKLLIVTNAHLGGTKVNKNFSRYVFEGRREDGVNIIDINSTWEKLVLAARLIASHPRREKIFAISTKIFGRKPVVKFSEVLGTNPLTGRFIPGSFTNTQVRNPLDPKLIIISDPEADKQAVEEASRVNVPVIAFVNSDNSLAGIDVAIPMNNRSPNAIGAGFFILSRLVSYMIDGEDLEHNLRNVELFFYRDPIELEKLAEEQKLSLEGAPAVSTAGSVPVSANGWNDY